MRVAVGIATAGLEPVEDPRRNASRLEHGLVAAHPIKSAGYAGGDDLVGHGTLLLRSTGRRPALLSRNKPLHMPG